MMGYESSTSSRHEGKRLAKFYSRIKSAKSEPVRAILERFYEDESFQAKPREEQAELVQDLMRDLEAKYREVWPDEAEAEAELSAEGIEAIVCKNLHAFIFSAPTADDERIEAQISKHQPFLGPCHLELPESRVTLDTLRAAAARLAQWNSTKAPAAKLRCVLDFIKAITAMLNETAKEPDGADVLLPTTILALLQLNPGSHLKSNLDYIRLFRSAERFDGQDEYYLTQLESAAEFILKLGPADLKISQEDYQRLTAPFPDLLSSP